MKVDFIEEIPNLEGLEVVRVSDFEEDVEEAAWVQKVTIEKSLEAGKPVVLDFSKMRFATQSFVHALVFKLLRNGKFVASDLSVANCSTATREVILTVIGDANAGKVSPRSIQADRAP